MKKIIATLCCIIICGLECFAQNIQYARDSLYIPNFSIKSGESKEVSIFLLLKDDITYSALQADIYLPEGLTIEKENENYKFQLSDRCTSSHKISAQETSDGAIRLILYSSSNQNISGREGDLITFTITTSEEFTGNKIIELKNIVTSTTDAKEYLLKNTSCTVYCTEDTPNSTVKTWKDIKIDFTNGRMLTPEETSITTFGVYIAEDGTIMRVDKNDETANILISGKYHSDNHGLTVFSATVKVEGSVKISMGTCAWGGDVTVKNSTGEIVASLNTCTDYCYSTGNPKVVSTNYYGSPTMLTISGGNYVPYISIEKIKNQTDNPNGLIYSWESPNGTPIEFGGTVISSTNSWKKNGEIGEIEEHVNNKVTVTDLTVTPNVLTDYWTLRLSGNYSHMNVTDQSTIAPSDYGRCAHVVITLDEALAEGDIITITGFRHKNSEDKIANIYMRLDDANGMLAEFADESLESPYANIHTDSGVDLDGDGNIPTSKAYIVPAEAMGTKKLCISRNKSGTNVYITKITITRTVSDSPATPEIEGTPLTADMFKTWDSATNPTTGTNVSCEYTLNESTGVIYGDTYLGYLNYANLSGYDQLVVTVSEGTPRFLFNRIVDLGQDADNEAESQMIDIPTQAWGTERYLTVEGNIYTINLRKMVEEKSFAHLHGIKGANWANVTVTSMVLVDNKDFIESQGIIYTENSSNDSYTITSYTAGLPANVVIPAELDGLPVTAIGAEAFTDASVLKTLTIPATVNMVGDKAFSGCHNLMVMEWNATAPMLATCFDAAEAYGNMLVFTSNTDVNFAGNVVVNGQAEKIALTDGRPFRNPQAFTAKRITYTREFSKKTRVGMAGGWEGIILPFDVQLIYHEGKGSLAPFGHTASASTLPCWMAEWQQSSMTFVMSKANLANQPFIMEVPNSDEYDDKYNIEGTVTFSAENVTVHATTDMAPATGNGYSLQGTYEGETATGTVYALNDMAYTTGSEYFLPGGVFVANARDIRPFEAYIYNNQLTRSRYLPIQGGKANDMDEMLLKGETNKEDDAWYTLQGTRLNGKPKQKGMYIHGSRVVRVR